MISPYGDIKDSTGKISKQYLNGDGYPTASIPIDGVWRTFGVHRLVAAAYIDPEPFFTKMVVNHRDLDKSNPHYSNLEWVTLKENAIHYAIFGGGTSFDNIFAYGWNGERVSFRNVFDCSAYTGLDPLDIWDLIRVGGWFNGWKVKFASTNDRVPHGFKKASIVERDSEGRKPKRAVKLLDVTSNEITEYKSISDLCRDKGLTSKLVNVSLRNRSKGSLIYRKYRVTYAEEEFSTLATDRLERLMNYGSREVYAFEISTGREKTFPSASAFYKEVGLSKKAVTTILVKNTLRVLEGMVFTYTDNTDSIMEIKRTYSRPGR
ncbi:putative HNH endonuclease [Serratia phage vB_SmaS-Totoro]|nr:putative HNH endonuclease [Serratia phage vB_SmaS-Totoro]